MRRILPYVVMAALLPTPGLAQEDDGTFLEGLIERSLTGAGREVRVIGFRGALSSTATMERLTIADDAGIWLTLEDVTLDWNRLALVRGRLSVNSLSAGSINLARLPSGDPEAAAPSPEASGFQLPELPVAVRVGEISSPAITFGEPVFGIESAFALQGNLTLEDGEGAGLLDIDRIDGPEGNFLIDASFSNATEVLEISVALQEESGGIVATLAGFPGEPSVDLSFEGQGPLSNFAAELALSTDGEERLLGTLAIGGEDVGAEDPRPFRAELSGDIAPLFAPEYQEFFGEVSLDVAGVRSPDGALELDVFTLDARSITLDGTAATGPDGRPRRFEVEGLIASQNGAPVLLPIPGDPTRVDRVALDASFDADAGDEWRGVFRIAGLDRKGFAAEEILVDGGGNLLGLTDGGQSGFTANVDFTAEALDLSDPAAGEALGERVTGRLELTRVANEPLRIARFDISGESYAFESSGTLDIADRDLAAEGQARVSAADLSVFAGIAGRPLAGEAELGVSGRGTILGGTFDAAVDGRTIDLSIGIPQIDNIVAGRTNLTVQAARNLEGITLETFRLASPVARVAAEGAIRSAGTRLDLSATLDDGALVLPGLDGSHSLSLLVEGNGEVWTIRSRLTGATLSGSVEGELNDSGAVPAFDGIVTLDAASLAPFAEPAGLPDLSGRFSLNFEGAASADLSSFDLRIEAEEQGLTLGRAELDALLEGGLSLTLDAAREPGGPVSLSTLAIAAPGFSAAVEGTVTGLPNGLTALDAGVVDTAAFDGTLSIDARDLSPLGPIAGLPGLAGSLSATLAGDLAANLSRFDLRLDARERDLTLDRSDLDALLSGGLSVSVAAVRESAGPVSLQSVGVETPTISLSAEGELSGLPGALVPPPPDLAESAVFTGRLSLNATDLAPVGPLAGLPRLGGALQATIEGSVAASLETLDLRLDANGANLRTGIAAADTYLAGGTVLGIDVARADGLLDIRRARFASPGLNASAEGSLGADGSTLSGEVRIDDLGRIVEGFAGPAITRVQVDTGATGPWRTTATVDGPGGMALRGDGVVARDFDQVDVTLRGNVPLGLANTFIAPRSVSGNATLDLRVSGPPALSSISGQITTSDTRLVAPTFGIVLEQVNATIVLASSRATIDVASRVQGGGRILVEGPVGLSPPFSADLRVSFREARFRDPSLYDTSVNGNITLSGPLAGGANIAGRLSLGQTELRIPSGVTGGAAPIPEIVHVDEPRPVLQTRIRAGIVDENGNGAGADQDGRGPAYGLDLRIDAPNRIFIRGRGLDAELGGGLRIGGTTANVIPSGQFELVRGRLDILGRRLTLDQGSITLQGDFDPFLRLVATTETDGIAASVVMEGPLSDPDVRFESSPELPQDEIVARILFGRGIDNISAFQAAQLAASVATLTGRGGEGLLGGLREGFGLDNLDITTNEAGQAELTLGTYISDNIYTDVTVSDGRTELEINLELTPSVTLQGSAADDGTSRIGIWYERDY